MLYNKILISLDNLEDEKNVIGEAMRVVKALDAELIALHVNDPGAGKPHMMMGSLPLVEEKDIREAFKNLGYTDMADKMSVIIKESEDYPKEIAEASIDADLLIIGHRHKSQILAFLSDSIDEQVSDLIHCPMLVVPEKK